MSREMQLMILGVVVAVICLGAALLPGAIRRKDFQDQVSGKKPERKAGPDVKYSYDRPQEENSQVAIDREILRTKAGQNLLGPH